MKNYNVTSEELRESVRKAAYHSALELLADEYFVDSWDGLFTVDDIAVWYNDNTDAEEVLDNLIECYDDIAEDINGELSEVVSLLASIDNGEYTPTVGEDIGAEWLENNETLY